MNVEEYIARKRDVALDVGNQQSLKTMVHSS